MKDLILAASGAAVPDFVLKNARILNVFTGEWLPADIAVCGDFIAGIGSYTGKTEVDAGGRCVVPGFINTHVHIESTMVSPSQMAAEIVPWGTTTIIADPHEVANVKGIEGIAFMIEQSRHLPCDVFIMLPSCVPALPDEDSGAALGAEELASLKGREGVLGLAEVMNFTGVAAADPETVKKLVSFASLPIDGHAPNMSGKALQAYCAAGISTDHECSTAEEVLEKLRAGMYILAREGSSAKNVRFILRALEQAGCGFDRVAFCTDDKHIFDIRQKGEIAENIRLAIAMGIKPADAYRMASYNGARMYGLRHLGAIAPSYQADFVVLEDVSRVGIHSVYKRGKKVSEGTTPLVPVYPDIPAALLNTVNCAPVTEADLRLPCRGGQAMPVIQLIPGQILTRKVLEEVPQSGGFFDCGADSGYQKIAAIERHRASGKIGLGIVSGFNLQGAVATTVSHDSHNIIVAGSSDRDMLCAVEQLVKQQGGFVCARGGKILGSLALPVCGLMSAEPTETVLAQLEELKKIAHDMGIPKAFDPFVTLSFLALPVIPQIRITTRGIAEC